MKSKLISLLFRYILTGLVILIPGTNISAQTSGLTGFGSKDKDLGYAAGSVVDCMRTHDVGNLVFGISNFGRIGTGAKPFVDCFTSGRVPQAEFPRGSFTTYIYKGAIWVGAIKDGDTLVSCGADFNTPALEMHSEFPILHRSTLDPDGSDFGEAVSEQDYIAVYTDTFRYGVQYPSFDPVAARSHAPLNLEITQRSYAWSYDYANDFAIIEYTVKNIGHDQLTSVYLGIYMDADVHEGGQDVTAVPPKPGLKGDTGGRDDLTGFLFSYPGKHISCDIIDTIGLAWTIDNDGDFTKDFGFGVPHVTGIRLLGDILNINNMAYNWWVWNYSSTRDYGPQKKENFRNMGNGLGTPIGDVNKYAMMSNREIDFSQPYLASYGQSHFTWITPSNSSYAQLLSTSGDCQTLLSVGPFSLGPGDDIVLPIAFVAGENVHTDHRNYPLNLANNYRPDVFMSNLDFSDLASNAVIASRIYDNPGVDTDGNGYAGRFHVCELDSTLTDSGWILTLADTLYYQGDGIPDFKGAAPPAAPRFWVEPAINGLRIRFNGYLTETGRDAFSGVRDFEGYRIYLSRDDRESSYFLAASYDRENYGKMVYDPNLYPLPGFVLRDIPFTLPQLRCLYGTTIDPCDDTLFHPLNYTVDHPYVMREFPDSSFYFVRHDFNSSNLGYDTPIRKLYQDEPKPDLTKEFTPDQLTDDGFPKYYEYEIIINDLLSTVPYYINVTAFDFGSPESGLLPLETSKLSGTVIGYAAGSEADLVGEQAEAYVFPNPYRLDANYRDHGYEGRGDDFFPDYRVRKINFANLPHQCTIRIYTLDGDLVRELDHNFDISDPASRNHSWDLVTRNRQLVVSGIYYWTVEDKKGRTQVGKLIILL